MTKILSRWEIQQSDNGCPEMKCLNDLNYKETLKNIEKYLMLNDLVPRDLEKND